MTPFTTHEDRIRLWMLSAIIGTVILLTFSIAAPAQEYARQDDDRERVTISTAKTIRTRPARNSLSLSGVVAPLAVKAKQITEACGSKVVSAVRTGARIFGGSYSNHASGKAVDLQGNPSCIYAYLKDWPGGVSTDYWTAPGGPHVHVSYSPNGMEWGLRFIHRHGKSKRAVAKR